MVGRVRARVAGHGDGLQNERVELAAERLHRRINQADDGIAGIAGGGRVERERNGADRRVREQLRRGRRVEDNNCNPLRPQRWVVFQAGQCGIGGGSVVELQAVEAELVVAAGDFCAEQFGQGVNVRARLELHEQFVGERAGPPPSARAPRCVAFFITVRKT